MSSAICYKPCHRQTDRPAGLVSAAGSRRAEPGSKRESVLRRVVRFTQFTFYSDHPPCPCIGKAVYTMHMSSAWVRNECRVRTTISRRGSDDSPCTIISNMQYCTVQSFDVTISPRHDVPGHPFIYLGTFRHARRPCLLEFNLHRVLEP